MAGKPPKPGSYAALIRRASGSSRPPPTPADITISSPPNDQSERSSEKVTVAEPLPEKIAENGKFSLGDLVVLVSCALFAEPFCHAAADAFLHGDYGKAALGFGLGVPPGLIGGSFHWWKGRLGATARKLAVPVAMGLGAIGIFLAFAYVAGPEMFRMAAQRTSSGFGFAETAKLPTQQIDLNWSDALYIESIFLNLPHPCLVRLTGARNADVNTRNILAKIIRDHNSCGIVDNSTDQGAIPQDIDKPPPPTVRGLIVRWHEVNAPGRQIYNALKGNFCPVVEGHAMPKNSPPNLIWIVVGDGYPWPHTATCQ